MRTHASLCVIRVFSKTGFTGPILASITVLTKLVELYAAPPQCGLRAESGVRTSTLWRRVLNENRFSGSVPSEISVLTAVTLMYVPMPAITCLRSLPVSLRRPGSKSRCVAGHLLEIGSRAECRRRSSRCASLSSLTLADSSTHRRRPLLSIRPR